MYKQSETSILKIKSSELLLSRLRKVVKEKGYCSEEDIKKISIETNVPFVKVFEVATFYSFLSVTPKGKHIIRICHSPTCYITGSENLIKSISKILGIKPNETTKDNKFTLELTSCLGCCDNPPAAFIDDKLYTNLTEAKLIEIINSCK